MPRWLQIAEFGLAVAPIVLMWVLVLSNAPAEGRSGVDRIPGDW